MAGTCFTYYWANREWTKYEERGEEGKPLLYAGGSSFYSAGIDVGNFVYVFGEINAQL